MIPGRRAWLAAAAGLVTAGCLARPAPPPPEAARPARTLRGHDHTVTSLAVVPDGSLLASGSRDGTVRLWRLPEGTPSAVLDAGRWSFATWAIAISPDGTRLASANDDLTIRVWALPGGRRLAAFRAHADSIRALAWSPDGRLLASGSRDGDAVLWRPPAARPLARFPHGNTVRAVAWSADGARLFTGSADDLVGVWDVRSASLVRFVGGHGNTVHALALTPDGRILASGSADRTIRLWNARTLDPLGVLSLDGNRRPPTRAERWGLDPGPEVLALAVSPDGQLLASAHRGGPLRLWDLWGRRLAGEIPSPSPTSYALAFSPDGARLFSGGDDDLIHEWPVPAAHRAQGNPAAIRP